MSVESTAGTSILVIDDDPDVSTVVRMALEDDGYRVTCCVDPSASIDTILDLRPKLVILDWRLSGSTGQPLFYAVRQDSRTASIPVLIFTADWKIRERWDELVGRQTHILLKPFELDELIEMVREMTAQQQASQVQC